MRTGLIPRLAVTCALLCWAVTSFAATSLETGFVSPPASARPWVYWFWLNGNITREGITADLEAMKRVGIGGVLIMEVDQGAPVGPIGFMSTEWRELFKHVVSEAGRLGLEVNMNNDAGWNGSGGPWIKPEQSMQKVVWSEADVEGPKRFEAALQQPETVAGFYRDITVLAFPTPGSYRIPDIGAKAAYGVGGVGPPARTELAPEMLIDQGQIKDISAQMDQAGRLVWDVPPGKWTIIRFGHTSTGAVNAPAPASGRGLECDKLSKEGSEANFNGMIAKLIQDVGPAAGKAFAATHVDSWENGSQNWTERMRDEFQQRRGYDMLPFLPVMTGRVIGSLEISERFLWDLRRTISDLVVENYAGHLRDLAHAHGLRFTIEAYGSPCDNIPYGGRADEPMGEFWSPGAGAIETCRGMASAGHVYGKPIIGAEAFTAGGDEKWREHPAAIKSMGDRAFCEGINRFVFHRYALQPWVPERVPGMTMGPWGQHYERTQTWWNLTPAWHRYLSRCQYMLRQGLFVADICYLQPESPPQALNTHDRHGYDWDECGAEVVLTRMSVKNGRIVLPDGMSYGLLVLQTDVMTPQLLSKIGELVRSGATVIGPRPVRSPSLTDHPACDEEVKSLADEIWADCDGIRISEHRYGRGRVVQGVMPEKLLRQSGVGPDFTSGEPLRCIHRRVGGTDIYFVSNQRPHGVATTATFRATGKVPEFWWPDTGRIERAAMFEEKNGTTSVALRLEPSGSLLVVFRERVQKSNAIVSVKHNGKCVLTSTPGARVKLVVEKALYGPPGDPKRTRDVRGKVQQRADDGEYSFTVASLAWGDDPAPNVVKTLVVDYVIGGKRFTVTGRDPDTIHLTGIPLKVTVHKATYGVPGDPKRTRDVREKLQRMVDAGERSFQVARLAAGDDPASMVVKTLVLECTIDGRRVTITGTDPETIDLASSSGGAEPPCEVRSDGGSAKLTAWQPGRYSILRTAGGTKQTIVPSLPAPLEINGPWEVGFPPNWGAPQSIGLERLVSLSAHSNPGVRYFSGTATYRATFTAPKSLLAKGGVARLDLGNVQVIAQVKLNGKDLGVLWKPPFRADITGLLKPGQNQLEVRVTNLWPNRMIGDEQMPEDSERNSDGTLKSWPQWLLDGKPSPSGRYTFTSWRLWRKDDALLPSGLIGPVVIRVGRDVVVD